MAGEEEVLMACAPSKVPAGVETGELALQLLCRGMVSFCIVSADSVYNRGIDRMNTHNDDFKERHDFGLFEYTFS